MMRKRLHNLIPLGILCVNAQEGQSKSKTVTSLATLQNRNINTQTIEIILQLKLYNGIYGSQTKEILL